MPRINILPKNIADLIAAGEVVERPSSVIKEFVENSIDAGATQITVEIKNGGKTYIRVTDNGCGIERDDVKKAFISHATSKISSVDDLNSISTLGFRGEALASVCAVSRVEVMTATENSQNGTRYIIEGGEEVFLDDVGCPNGTTIIVRDLFYNIPARMKFLKKDVQEGNYISTLLERIALSNPGVSFKFIRDGKLQFSTPGDGVLKTAVYSVFGKSYSEELLYVENEQNGISVKGYVTKPTACRNSRAMQIFFVNSRYVKNVIFLSALEAAYKNSVMTGKYPGCVLFVDLPFEAVDVNVHPAKTEVRFYDEKRVFDTVYQATLSALQNDTSRVQAVFSPAKYFAPQPQKGEQMKLETEPAESNSQSFVIKEYGNPITGTDNLVHAPEKGDEKQLDFLSDEYLKPHISKITISTNNGEFKNTEKVPTLSSENSESITLSEKDENDFSVSKSQISFEHIEKVDNSATDDFKQCNETDKDIENGNLNADIPHFKYIGQAFETYLIAQTDDEKLLIIDKHAAHERILFEKFKNEGVGQSQMMLVPITVTLSPDEYSAVIENTDLLAEAGYDISDFGNQCVKVSACPPELIGTDIAQAITEIAGYLSHNVKTLLPEKIDWLYHSMACRAAVKAGNFTSDYEAERFIETLLLRNDIRYCPHGRPVMVEMTRKELEKQFKRIV